MKNFLKVCLLTTLVHSICFGQQANKLIEQVKMKQQSLVNIAYQLNRIDTIGTYIRQMKGNVVMEKNELDTVFGFKFWASKQDDPIDKVYDGHVGYAINTAEKSFEMTTSSIGFSNLENGGGGHLILKDLIKLDTTGAIRIELSEDVKSYVLVMVYPDLTKYEVTKRFKKVWIDKESLLPIAVRQHQESLGRIQDLYFEVTKLSINQAAAAYNFTELEFLKSYTHVIPKRETSPISKLIGHNLPYFKVSMFANGTNEVAISELKGKVVLLDFWEVWCSPCIESMPKIDELYKKYKSNGLLVYGIINDKQNLSASKQLVKKKDISFPMALGSEDIKAALKINSIPLYIILNKYGKVVYYSHGYADGIEKAIIEAIDKN